MTASWSAPTTADEMRRRAAGRRNYNAMRRSRALRRRRRIAELLGDQGGLTTRGTQARLAAELGVSRATICRDVAVLMQTGGPCPTCGAYRPGCDPELIVSPPQEDHHMTTEEFILDNGGEPVNIGGILYFDTGAWMRYGHDPRGAELHFPPVDPKRRAELILKYHTERLRVAEAAQRHLDAALTGNGAAFKWQEADLGPHPAAVLDNRGQPDPKPVVRRLAEMVEARREAKARAAARLARFPEVVRC